jgi:hypothetical protein
LEPIDVNNAKSPTTRKPSLNNDEKNNVVSGSGADNDDDNDIIASKTKVRGVAARGPEELPSMSNVYFLFLTSLALFFVVTMVSIPRWRRRIVRLISS